MLMSGKGKKSIGSDMTYFDAKTKNTILFNYNISIWERKILRNYLRLTMEKIAGNDFSIYVCVIN